MICLLTSPEQARRTLLDIIYKGEKLLRDSDINDKMFDVWFDCSRKGIQRALGNNAYSIESDYLDLNIAFLRYNVEPIQKLRYCIEFILSIIDAL